MARSAAAESVQEASALLVAVILGGAFTVWGLWVTFVAFTGGAAPLVQFDGPDFGRGILVLMLGVPIVGTVAYWIGMAVTMAVAVVAGGIVGLVVRD